MKKGRIVLFAILIFLGTVGMAQGAVILNLDAMIHSVGSSARMNVFLENGSYDVTPIGRANGGMFNAWSSGSGGWEPSYSSWVNRYAVYSPQFGTVVVDDGVIYGTEFLALANAEGTAFTLESAGWVQFYLIDPDNMPIDNVGGMSLAVSLVPPAIPEEPIPTSPVPIPSAFLLFGSGAVGLAGLKRTLLKKR